MIEAFDLLEEARWEALGTRRATEAYRDAATKVDPSTLPSGQKLLREVVPLLTQQIAALKLQGGQMIAAGRQAPKWAAPIQLLGADVLAVLTLARILDYGQDDGQGSGVTSLARDIAQAIRDEIDYRNWVEAQIAANKAAKKDMDWSHKDLLKAFMDRYPNADRRVWKTFRTKLDLAKATPWDQGVAVQLGSALVYAAVQAAPERFQIAARPVGGGRTQAYLRLSQETREVMADVEARAEVARPMLMPMIMPPIPWRYV